MKKPNQAQRQRAQRRKQMRALKATERSQRRRLVADVLGERSLQAKQEELQSLEARAAKLAFVEQFDGFAGLRNRLGALAKDRGEWAGIPMLLSDHPLTIEPTYPRAEDLMGSGRKTDEEADDLQGAQIINRFWSVARRSEVIIWQTPDGKRDWGMFAGMHSLGHQMETLACCDAWGIRQESEAVQTLGSLVRHRQFRQYMLTGMFMEESQRSGVHYLFRRLRPTLALTLRGKDGGECSARILCALCLHPIGYYDGSWAGAMCPTDDVIAHLTMMRGDEHMFWRRANQHPSWHPSAGLV